MSDPYVYPGTTILKNKADLRTQDELDRFERLMTRTQMGQKFLPAVEMTYEGYKALHHHLFQDVYDWAGQSRTVHLAKGQDYFGPPDYVDREMARRFDLLAKEHHLQGLSQKHFAKRAAEHLNEINAIHPFREGNGRTQRLFLKVLAKQAGHDVHLDRITPKKWNDASIKGFAGNYEPMEQVIQAAMGSRLRSRSRERGTGRTR